MCDKPAWFEDRLRCYVCKERRHYSCARYSTKEVRRIRKYVCESCEHKTGELSTWKGKEAVGKVLEDKIKHYFEVEKILDHIIDAKGRVFLIKWQGYTSPTWEIEEHLDGCLNMLQSYCRRNDIKASKIEGKLGDAEGSSIQNRNFVTISQIIDIIRTHRSMGIYCTDLEIGRQPRFGKQDKLFVFGVMAHCYVLLYVSPDRVYIADGLNSYIDDLARRSMVNREIKASKVKIRSIRFDQQVKIDHCGSSAALVALELMRAYKLGRLDTINKLVAPITLRRRIRAALHQYPSTSVNILALTDRREKWVCETCGKSFKKRKALEGHKLSHRLKETSR